MSDASPTGIQRAIAANIRAERARVRLSQQDVADAMRARGFAYWHAQTAGAAERGDRRITADELVVLAVVLGARPGTLLGIPEPGIPETLGIEIAIDDRQSTGRSSMPTGLPGTWREPDSDLLDQLTHHAMFAADSEAMKPGVPSRIRNPDGSQQGETSHEHTTRVTRAALRMLLANGLVIAVAPLEWPEWVVLDPPGDDQPRSS